MDTEHLLIKGKLDSDPCYQGELRAKRKAERGVVAPSHRDFAQQVDARHWVRRRDRPVPARHRRAAREAFRLRKACPPTLPVHAAPTSRSGPGPWARYRWG